MCGSHAFSIPVGTLLKGRVKHVEVPRIGYRWKGGVTIELPSGGLLHLVMTGTIAQWLIPGEELEVLLTEEPRPIGKVYVSLPGEYEAWRIYQGEKVKIWPPWSSEDTLVRRDPLNIEAVYEYKVIAREAVSESDHMEIVQLEQHHYASKEEIVAIWRCPVCGRYEESNIQPTCPVDKIPMRLQEIRGSLPSSRFMVLELVNRKPYEPRIVGYVRIDTPIPLMSRRLPDGSVQRLFRDRVFPKEWFHPTYWPEAYVQRKEIVRKYRELAYVYGSRRLARAMVGEEISSIALRNAATAAARIARVVIHPDYRSDGLGVLAVRKAVEWVRERRIPEMKRGKHIIEVIAQMARYNPFFEKVGFKYVWDTASGRPVLMYPLTDEARRKLEEFLRSDPYAVKHSGVLYRPRFRIPDPMNGPIKLKGVTKAYSSLLDISRMPKDLQDILKAFGVERRLVERYVLRNVNLTINPGEVVAVLGASGSGKTTLLRMIIGKAASINDPSYRPDEGEVIVPNNVRIQYLLPNEHEPKFGDETLLDHVCSKLKDPVEAVEVLNLVGLSDAVFYRAKFTELSTGQKERAKFASMLAEKPNLMIIDEFTAHLDSLTAMRVARRLAEIARRNSLTLIVATNRPEVLRAMKPDRIVYISTPNVFEEKVRTE